MNDSVNLSSILSGTLDQLRASARSVLIYLAVMTPLSAASIYFEDQAEGGQSSINFGLMIDEALVSQGALAVTVVIAVFVIGLVASYWLYAGMVRHTDAPSFDRFFPFLGIYILSSLAIGFGFLLVIIPGLILMVRWAPLLPAVIDRETGAMDAFGESWGMTDGYGWSIFGAALVICVCFLFAAITFGVATYFGPSGSILTTFLGAIIEIGFTVIMTAFAVTVYFQLRDDSDELAEVFE